MSVDLFKQLLRAAIAAKATALLIRADKTPSIEGPSGLSELPATTINSAQILEILDGIAPGDKAGLLSQGKSRGSLNLGAGGKVGFICTAANGSATSMHVFFLPVAEKQFEEHWVKLHSPQASKDSPPATTGNVLPPEAFSVMAAVKSPVPAQATATAALPITTVAATPQPAAVVPPAAPTQNSPLPATTQETAKATILQEIDYGAYFKGEQTVSNGENEIDRYLKEMVKRKASDLHLTGGQPVIFRADGEITRLPDTSLTAEYMRQILEPIIPPRNREEIIKINDTDFAYEVTNVGRFRVNVFRDRNGIGAVLRHIPATILTAEQLKLAPAITNFCKLHKGLVLVTGPTGSGKSTTLAAMLDLINKNRHDHILTVEDPIEFVHPQQKCLVNQREVHRHTTSFARALKAALREDPDIVLIGEMRDLETISIAIETAETGHLVFGTLHTTTAVSTVDRIIQQFPAERQEQIRMMLAGGLRGVVAQTLLKKIGGGRVAAHEILVVNDAVSAMIREGKNHMIPNHMQTQKADGNLLLNESLMNLVSQNLVTPADAYSKSVDKNTLADMMKRKGIDTTPFELRKSA
ncbi:MAG: hypothetical protein RIQ81_281 [Pseudomonadota bacterium]